MRLPPFQLYEPESLAEAVGLLTSLGAEARPVAGGTVLVPMIRFGLLRPEHVVSLQRLPGLRTISSNRGELRIGALVTHSEVARSQTVRAGWPLLARAAGTIATPAIRNMGTVGGNLCYAESASDLATALLVLEASVHLHGANGERTVPVTRFFLGFYEADIQPCEVLAGISVPAIPEGTRYAYLRYATRGREDRPLVNVAALATAEGVRLALGGVAPTAIRAHQAEAMLRDGELTEEAIKAAMDAAAAACDPLTDLMGSADYRRHMVRVWVRRALSSLHSS